MDALFSAAPVGLAFLDTSLRYVRINDVLAAWNGPPAAEHLGHTPQEILGEPGRELERLLLRVLETGEPIIGHEVSRGPPVDSGPRHTFLVSYFVARVLPEQPRGLGAVVVDITDIKRAEQQLRDSVTFRERFLGIVTHDLRSPLQTIRLSADALAKAEDVPERHRKTVGRIRTNVDWMVRMIDELLDFTRSRLGGGIPISPREVDLRGLVQQLMEEAGLSHPERAITLSAEGDFLGCWDADRLTQVVSNLVGNALQHSPAGTPVEVRLAREGERVRLEVHNQGPPIPSELLPHVFDPFRGAKKQPSKEEGLGLGLYIVQQIIQAHGGRIDVSSSEEGTSFRVELPPRVPPTKG
ncbi:MAG TPA: ATP-binding protein [Myxococcaceae bacterium]|nr:ATP-binding protein [Myxococcaceae bacterium]